MRTQATWLESFRLFMQPDQEWMSEQDLIAALRGEFTPTIEIEIGQAFGRVLESPERYWVEGGYRVGPHFFSAAMMDPALALFERRGVFEPKAVKRYGDVDVVSKADQLLGTQLIETKTTWSTFNFDKYTASYQWRYMADAFKPQVVTYRVFRLSEDRCTGELQLLDAHEFNLYPYVGLHADCVRLLDRFVAFVRAKDLEPLLQERQARLAGAF